MNSHMSFFVLFLLVVRSILCVALCLTSSLVLLGTGIFQPADVGPNHVIKHCLKQHQTEYLVNSHQKQIDSGLTTEQVKFTTSLPVLRDASVAGIVAVYDFMTGPFRRELIQKVSLFSSSHTFLMYVCSLGNTARSRIGICLLNVLQVKLLRWL